MALFTNEAQIWSDADSYVAEIDEQALASQDRAAPIAQLFIELNKIETNAEATDMIADFLEDYRAGKYHQGSPYPVRPAP